MIAALIIIVSQQLAFHSAVITKLENQDYRS
jgi:hypothetical protein